MLDMKLYRGTNKVIKCPKINPKSRFLNFGAGCYYVFNKKIAERDAQEMTHRMQCGSPVVNIYEIDKEALKGLKVLKIAKPDMDWLTHILACRKGVYNGEEYDVILAPLPCRNLNDRICSCEMHTKRKPCLFSYKKTDFFNAAVFKTEAALSLIKFSGTSEIEFKPYIRRNFSSSLSLFNLISPIIKYVSMRTGMSKLRSLEKFYFSDIYEKINDLSLKLGYFSGRAIGEMLVEELETGKLSYPDEDL